MANKENRDLDKTLNELIKKLSAQRGLNIDGPNSGDNKPHIMLSINWGFLRRWGLVALLLVAVLLWIISGFFQVLPSEKALVFRFGAYQTTYEHGLYWVPRFLDKVYIFNTQQLHTISVNDEVVTADGKIAVIKVNLDYTITDGRAFYCDNVNSVLALRSATMSAIYELAHTVKLHQLLRRSVASEADLNSKLIDILAPLVKSNQLGIAVKTVDINEVTLPDSVLTYVAELERVRHKVERDLEDVLAYKQQLVESAESQKRELLSDAQNFKQVKLLQTEADLKRYRALLPFYKNTPKQVRDQLYLQTLDDILSANSAILLHNPQGGKVSLDIGDLLQKIQSKPKQAENIITGEKVKDLISEKKSTIWRRPLRQDAQKRLSY